jgi:formate hydrogenlyase subunit 4
MTSLVPPLLFLVCLILLPFLTVGTIRKTKALLQGRIGAPPLQPLFDFCKLIQKGQRLSSTMTWIFPTASCLNLATMLLIAWLVPWLPFKPMVPGDDIFFILYAFALLRFAIILSALDSGSPFGAFGSSREAFLGMLAEPAMFLSMVALGLIAHDTSLAVIFTLAHPCSIYEVPVWLAAAVGFYLYSLVDLSRMPVDDPTTHLELTMVHEAMVIENSGANLALTEFTHMLKLVVLFGLTAQCLLHVVTFFQQLSALELGLLSVALILAIAVVTALVESATVKLAWKATPNFVAYALTAALLASISALIGGVYASHGL